MLGGCFSPLSLTLSHMRAVAIEKSQVATSGQCSLSVRRGWFWTPHLCHKPRPPEKKGKTSCGPWWQPWQAPWSPWASSESGGPWWQAAWSSGASAEYVNPSHLRLPVDSLRQPEIIFEFVGADICPSVSKKVNAQSRIIKYVTTNFIPIVCLLWQGLYEEDCM